jgi:toxin ParE1/3/4
MSEVRFSDAAQSDLLDIVVFIARDNPLAAENWLAAIEERCRLLADHPLTGEQRPGFGEAGCRSVSAGAYVIFFRPMQSGVEIARVVHGKCWDHDRRFRCLSAALSGSGPRCLQRPRSASRWPAGIGRHERWGCFHALGRLSPAGLRRGNRQARSMTTQCACADGQRWSGVE